MNTQFLAVKEVSDLLNKSEKWVYKHKENIPGFFVIGKSIFFDKTILLDWIKKNARR